MSGLRLAGHPVHAVLTDFPLALLSAAALWDVVGLVTRETRWWEIAFWTLLLGVVALLPTAVTGFVDFLSLPQDSPAGPTAIRHMVAMLVAGTLFTASLLLRGGPTPPDALAFGGEHALSLGGVLVLLVGGRLGGALVFRHGVGLHRGDRPGDPDHGQGEPTGRPG